MNGSSLETAKLLLKRRKFSSVIKLLETKQELYREEFDYYITFGTACLYAGDTGNAYNLYQKAREIRLSNANLMLGQAAIFLRRGNIDKALQYYLDILNFDPNNKIAKSGMEFIRKYGDYETVYKWVDSGKIKRFYPPLGVNPDIIRNLFLAVFLWLVVLVTVSVYKGTNKNNVKDNAGSGRVRTEIRERKDDVLDHSNDKDVIYVLSEAEIQKSLDLAMSFYRDYDDNASQVEINRILNSNASDSIKQKARRLKENTVEPTFDLFDVTKDKHYTNYSYSEVVNDPYLYNDCYVVWNGRISNVIEYDDGSWSFDLLVGYEGLKKLDGVVRVKFQDGRYFDLDDEKGLRVLGKLDTDNDILMEGILVYQPLSGKFPS